MSKNNFILQTIAVIVIISVSIVVFFFPDTINNDKFSYENIVNKKDEVDSLTNMIISNESVIEEAIERLHSTEKRAREVEKEANLARQGVNDDYFVLDIPSLLIELEQNAYKNNVELKIRYNSIVSTLNRMNEGDTLEGEEYTEDFGEPADEDIYEDFNENEDSHEEDLSSVGGSLEEQEDEDVTLEKQNIDEEQDVNEEQDDDDDEEISLASLNLPDIEGISITVIPISISGKYSDVRNYIKYLDQVGMIEPYSVKLRSDGNSISGSVILSVFHEEVY